MGISWNRRFNNGGSTSSGDAFWQKAGTIEIQQFPENDILTSQNRGECGSPGS
jgi:hypothetical protein